MFIVEKQVHISLKRFLWEEYRIYSIYFVFDCFICLFCQKKEIYYFIYWIKKETLESSYLWDVSHTHHLYFIPAGVAKAAQKFLRDFNI
jgi:hypothetical protein